MLTMNLLYMDLYVGAESKYDYQDWMKDEKLDNCGGFARDYYHDLSDTARRPEYR